MLVVGDAGSDRFRSRNRCSLNDSDESYSGVSSSIGSGGWHLFRQGRARVSEVRTIDDPQVVL